MVFKVLLKFSSFTSVTLRYELEGRNACDVEDARGG